MNMNESLKEIAEKRQEQRDAGKLPEASLTELFWEDVALLGGSSEVSREAVLDAAETNGIMSQWQQGPISPRLRVAYRAFSEWAHNLGKTPCSTVQFVKESQKLGIELVRWRVGSQDRDRRLADTQPVLLFLPALKEFRALFDLDGLFSERTSPLAEFVRRANAA